MRRIFYLVLGIAIAAGTVIWWRHCTAAPGEEGIAYLRRVKAPPFSELTSAVSPYCYALHRVPMDFLAYPADITPNTPHIALYHIPIGSHWVYMLFQDLPGGQTRVWVDTNLDNRLYDETPLSGISQKYSEHRSQAVDHDDFGTIHLSAGIASAPAFNLARIGKHAVRPTPAYIHTGTLRLGNQHYRIAVIDSDYSGTFDTFMPSEGFLPWKHDAIVVDPGADALLGRKHFDHRKLIPLGRYYKLHGRYYRITFAEDGTSVQMTPAEPAMGTLKVANVIRFDSHLLSDAATQPVNFRNEIAIPAGRYQIQGGLAVLTFTGTKGDEWQMSADFRDAPRKGIFEIVEGQTTTLNPGPPFAIKTDIRKRSGNELSINASLVGNEGETYSLRIGRTAARPEVKILAENGDTLHAGAMEYG